MEVKNFKVNDLIENLSEEQKDYVFNYVEFKVKNLVKFKGYDIALNNYLNLAKKEIGKTIERNPWSVIDNTITIESHSDKVEHKIKVEEKLTVALAIVLSYFKDAVNKVSKVIYDSVRLENVLDISELTTYERSLVFAALKIIVPVDEIAKTMKEDYPSIKEAHSYGEKELYWLRELYKNKIMKTYKLSNEMMEMVMDYVSMEYFTNNKFKDDEVTQMLNKKYRYIDSEKAVKKRNLDV